MIQGWKDRGWNRCRRTLKTDQKSFASQSPTLDIGSADKNDKVLKVSFRRRVWPRFSLRIRSSTVLDREYSMARGREGIFESHVRILCVNFLLT